jgi:hypothetical protein
MEYYCRRSNLLVKKNINVHIRGFTTQTADNKSGHALVKRLHNNYGR